MATIFADKVLTPAGWADNVRIATADGRITTVAADRSAGNGDVRAGIVVPGLANAHSHAFQRVLAGHTEHRGPAGKDNFWSWRTRMYALARQIDNAALEAIARQVYVEMVASGYTSVAEFHYLHKASSGQGGADSMFAALAAAARDSGIRLTYVPVFYERAGFSQPEPTTDQQHFACAIDDFVDHYRRAAAHGDSNLQVGIGAHSLRAVTADSLARIAATAAADRVPMHLHIAEQQREVEDCLESVGARPVEWLLANHAVDEHWCLVHATHVDDEELAAVAGRGAVVCLCPSTEANLGDGLFPLQAYLEHGGRIAIGSDSHVSVNPFEELRWLEYGQRLVSRRRNVAAIPRAETGRSLFELAAAGGSLACGSGAGGIREGAPADLIVLDDDSPMLAGHTTRSLLDALVFSGFTLPIDRVMVNGEWQVVDGRHRNAAPASAAYRDVAARLRLEELVS